MRSRRGFVVVAVAVGSGPEVSLGRSRGSSSAKGRGHHCLRASVTHSGWKDTAVGFRHGFWSAKFVDFVLVRVSETALTLVVIERGVSGCGVVNTVLVTAHGQLNKSGKEKISLAAG